MRLLAKSLICALLTLVGGLSAAQDELKVQTPFVAPKRWAVVIGASKYAHFGALNYTAADATSFGKALVEAYGFEPDNVRTLVDAEGTKPESLPTTANINGELGKILKNRALNKGDLFIFYFAGHGIGTAKGDYLVPTDATKENAEKVGLPIKDVIAQIVAAGLKNVLVICDACRAGNENPFGAELQALGKKANIAVILGCAPGRRSYEYPRLGHGIFTYMLERAMRSEGLRDSKTGALWASAIAKKVQDDVATYTERDYGQDKQVPSTWSEASTFDVLIGAYIGKDQYAQMGMAEILKLGKQLNKQSFAFYLRALGVFFFKEGKHGEAIEAFRTLEQLGEATPDDRISMAGALVAQGRDAEATRIYQQVLKESPNTFAGDLAALALDRALTTEDQRRSAARNLWLASKSWSNGYVYWITIAIHDAVSQQARQPVLQELLAHFGATSRAGNYFQASEAYLANDLLAALEFLNKAVTSQGTEPERNDILILFYQVSDRMGDEDRVDRIIALGKQDPKHIPFWAQIEAMRLDKKTPSQRAKSIEFLLSVLQGPSTVLMLTVQSGRQASDLLPQIREASKSHPFAWECHLAIWLAEQAATGFKYPPPAIGSDVIKYGPSELEVRREAWKNYADMLEVADLSYEVRNRFNRYFVRDLLKEPGKLGSRWQFWDTAQSFMNDLWLQLEMGFLAHRHIAPLVQKNQGTVQLREILLDSYISAGMWKEAEALAKSANWTGAEARGGDLRWAIALATQGRDAEARKWYSAIKPADQRTTKEMYQALGLLLDAREGKPGTLDKAKEFKPKNLIAQQLVALARFKIEMPTSLGKPSMDELTRLMVCFNTLTPMVINVNEIYRDVHGACLKAFDELNRYMEVTSPSKDGLDDLPVAIAMEHYGSPLYASLYFGLKPDVGQYVGEQTWTGKLRPNMDDVTETGTVKFQTVAGGSVTITMGPVTFKGTVDGFGNLKATGSLRGKKATVTAKLPPPNYKSKHFKDIPPRLLIITDDGTFAEFLADVP